MTFYDGQEKNTNIIKDYNANNRYIEVNYLFDDSSVIYPYTKDKEEEIIKEMVEQAIKRNNDLYNKINKETKIYLTQNLVNILSIILCVKGDLQFLFCICFLLGLYVFKNLTDNYAKLKELKKFRLYLSMKEELEKPENKDITKIIEFDPLYREPINMGTLDKFTYGEVKSIKKELKRRNNITGNFERA